MAEVIFSAGSEASDIKSGSPTVTIASGVATFSEAQTGNLVCGDEVIYNTNVKAYLFAKTSTSVWSIKTATGGTPSDITGSTVVSIKRAISSLSNAVHGAPASGQKLYDLIGNASLVTLTLKVRIAFCKDSAETITAITINAGWTTSASYYIEIFTPYSTATQCNTRQRHTYAFKSGSRLLCYTWSDENIRINLPYTVIDGIELHGIKDGGNEGGSYGFVIRANYVEIKNSIAGNMRYNRVIYTDWENNAGLKIHDNIFYHSDNTTSAYGVISLYGYEASNEIHFYNNIIFTSKTGVTLIRADALSGNHKMPMVFKNNILLAYGSEKCIVWVGAPSENFDPSYLGGTNPALSGYNITSDSISLVGSSGSGSQNSKTNTDVKFASLTAGSEDLRIGTGSCALAAGTGPSADSEVSVADIIEAIRSGAACDVGAFEITVAALGSIFRAANLSGLQSGGKFYSNPIG